MKLYASLSIFLLMVFLKFPLVHAQESNPQIKNPSVVEVSSTELLNQAKVQRTSDPELSSELAQKALALSERANDHLTNAQAHSFLGGLAHQAANTDQSMHHYLQASIEYEKVNDDHNQISSTLEYAALFFAEKRFSELDTILDTLLPIAQKYGDELSIASTLIAKGDSAYAQRRYLDAAKQFTEALPYLSDDKESAKSRLASTHHKIAQSQKRLRNHDEAALAYLNALNV